LTFVAGHGVLELAAVFMAAGAGLRLAQALIAPGDFTRRDALVLQGRIAAPMIGAVVLLLAVAGSIEGLLSASDAPVALKLGVSAASAVLLGLYLWNGWRHLGRREKGEGRGTWPCGLPLAAPDFPTAANSAGYPRLRP